jgi:hypothetical protein
MNHCLIAEIHTALSQCLLCQGLADRSWSIWCIRRQPEFGRGCVKTNAEYDALQN